MTPPAAAGSVGDRPEQGRKRIGSAAGSVGDRPEQEVGVAEKYCGSTAAGNVTVKTLPWPGWLSTAIAPPCASINSFAVVAPYILQDLFAAEHLTGVAHEEAQQVELLGCQLEAARPAAGLARQGVEVQIGIAQRLVAGSNGGPAQQGMDAGQQLGRGKWFDQVVVGAAFQPLHAVLDGITRRQHQYQRDRKSVV